MRPSQHIILGAIFSFLLYILSPQIGITGTLIIFLSSFLIDFDHYLIYVAIKKDLNPFKAYKFHTSKENFFLNLPRSERNKLSFGVYIFHGIELIAILGILAIIFNNFLLLFVITGFAFHLILDLFYQTTYWDRIFKFSLINDIIQYKKLRFIFPHQP